MLGAAYRSPLARTWNALAAVLPPAIAPRRLDVDEMIARVARKRGAGEWQRGPHVEAARRLVEAIEQTGRPHAFGRLYLREMFCGLFDARAALEAHWQRFPQILEQAVPRPLVILGLPRSGTSFLFNLLANDPAHRYLRNWETTVSQIPPPRPTSFDADPRRRVGARLMRLQRHLAPTLEHIHEFHLDGPEECTPLLMHGFATQALAGMFDVPAYSRWLDTVDHLPDYAHHKRVLQTLQAAYPAERWLLKSPDHLAGLDALLEVYPDACLIHLHRDPVQSVASWASLNAAFRGICSPQLDAGALGAQVLDRLATDMDAYLLARERHPASRFLDLPYRELIAAPVATVARIQAHFGLDQSEAARNAIDAFLGADREKVRSHRYRPEDFGLTPEGIRTRFGNYIARFAVPPAGG